MQPGEGRSCRRLRRHQGRTARGKGGRANSPFAWKTFRPGTVDNVEAPPRADIHADSPIKVFEHRERTSNTEVAGHVSVASLHNPQTHEQRDVDSRRFVI